ncbi:N-acetyl-alpha-D-glucosaminyl L-malate deacetylase 1 [Vibrio phage VH2_2019]|nr:N-acetyl-alpha-D-glucosaminyl L-malate deacetylase 1 [Vibrio phage VH2_2019]
MKKAVVISPHFDDMEFGCGGYIQSLIKDGYEVHSYVVCSADMKMRLSEDVLAPDIRIQEGARAAKVLGVNPDITVMGAPYNNLYAGALEHVVGFVEQALKKHSPDLLFIPLPSFHQDHQAVFTACIAALRPTAVWKGLKVLAYEYPMIAWGSSEPSGQIQGAAYHPISEEVLATKIEAISCHKSQVHGKEDSITGNEGVKALARIRGLECGYDYAEKFHVVKEYL